MCSECEEKQITLSGNLWEEMQERLRCNKELPADCLHKNKTKDEYRCLIFPEHISKKIGERFDRKFEEIRRESRYHKP